MAKHVISAAVIIALALMGAWAYGGSRALDDSLPEKPLESYEGIEKFEEAVDRQNTADWYGDADEPPKIDEVNEGEEPAEAKENPG